MTEKITGYVLLILGIILIMFSLVNVYRVFTGIQQPVSLSNSVGLKVAVVPDSDPIEVLRGEDVNQLTNITLYYLLMSFVVSCGFKVSTLGVQLLRPVEVKLSAKETLPNKS